MTSLRWVGGSLTNEQNKKTMVNHDLKIQGYQKTKPHRSNMVWLWLASWVHILLGGGSNPPPKLIVMDSFLLNSHLLSILSRYINTLPSQYDTARTTHFNSLHVFLALPLLFPSSVSFHDSVNSLNLLPTQQHFWTPQTQILPFHSFHASLFSFYIPLVRYYY